MQHGPAISSRKTAADVYFVNELFAREITGLLILINERPLHDLPL